MKDGRIDPRADRIIALYEDKAAAWDRQRGRDLFERPWLDRFLAYVPEGGHVLDLGCGMGEPIGAYLLSRGVSLTGVDASPSLIGLCRARFPGQRWIVGDMRSLALGERFDGILAWHSFFHLAPADQRRMFARFASHAAHGAPLMFTSGTGEGAAIGAWEGEPLYHGSLATAEYRTRLEANGFDLLAHVANDPTCGHATIWLARRGGQECGASGETTD